MNTDNNKVIEKAKENLSKQINPTMDKLLNTENTQMPEAVFKGRFLDSFANGGNPEAIKEFAGIAGSYYKEMDIVDDKTGKLLFTTPPMMESPDFNDIDELGKVDISGIAKETEAKRSVSHVAPTKVFDNTITSFEDKMVSKAVACNVKNKERWDLIFNKYDVSKVTKTSTTEDEGEIYEYE